MRVDALAVELRPRPMPEAADLGVLLARTCARSLQRTFAPIFAVVLLAALTMVEIAPWLPSLLIFWLKPWLDRSLLFVLSRAVFGQSTDFTDLWHNRAAVWWDQWHSTLLWRRLSPWRSFTQPLYQLEGQKGRARRKRRAQLLRARRGAAFGMHTAFATAETALYCGLLAMVVWLAPEGSHNNVLKWLFDSQSVGPALLWTAVYGTVVLVLEPLYVAAGFAMYLNRRVELEAWDIEQEFRRVFANPPA